jgi:hypothetical protein
MESHRTTTHWPLFALTMALLIEQPEHGKPSKVFHKSVCQNNLFARFCGFGLI